MKRTMFYKKKWGEDHPPFLCEFADKLHYPVIEVWVETPAEFKLIPYKDIDGFMYKKRTKEKSSFESLAKGIAEDLVMQITDHNVGLRGEIRVTVRVTEDSDFWVEVTEGSKEN